ncbi:MAG TPA: cytochrome c [Verrucomicrobiae bacterium]
MSESGHSIPVTEAGDELQAERRPVPVWLILFLFVLLYWGMVWFDERGGWFAPQVYAPYRSLVEVETYQPATAVSAKDRGAPKFEVNCALCHNSDGTGKPGQAPPFVKSEWVLGSPARLIRIPLAGLSGPIKVNGQEYNFGTSMAAMGVGLSDEDLAAVLTYIRQSWGNNASEITPEQVKAVRAEVGARTQPWTTTELEALP